MKTLAIQIRNVEDVVKRFKVKNKRVFYKLSSNYASKYRATAVDLKISKFEDTFIYTKKNDLMLTLFRLIERYVNNPAKTEKLHLSNLLRANWRKLPDQCKTKGHAYRIWIFNKAYTKRAIAKLANNQPLHIKSSEFLSFTSRLPTGASIFKKYWSVFRNSLTDIGSLVLIQKQEYKKGFSVTDFMQYLLSNGIIVEDVAVDESNNAMDFEAIDSADIVPLMNQEQEIFVMDDVLTLENKNIINIKVTVAKNDKKHEGVLVPAIGLKFVDVGSIDEARKLLRSLGLHV